MLRKREILCLGNYGSCAGALRYEGVAHGGQVSEPHGGFWCCGLTEAFACFALTRRVERHVGDVTPMRWRINALNTLALARTKAFLRVEKK